MAHTCVYTCMLARFSAVALLLFSFAGCSFAAAPLRAYAFVDVNVIPMDRERVIEHQTVIVRDGRIAQIGAASEVEIPRDATRIDGRGKFLMPGLVDTHVHLRTRNELPLYVASGVTTVFNLDGRPFHLLFRARTASGELLGPTIYTVGPKFDKARTAEESVAEVEAQYAAGYDGIKIYARVSKAEYPALLAAARKHHMFILGHVPREVGFEGTLAAGQALEHAEEIIYTYFNDTLDIDKLVFDESRIPNLVKLMRESGIWFTPTIVTYDQIMQQAANVDTFLQRPEMRFISPELRDRLSPAKNQYKRGFKPEQVPKIRENLAFQKKLVGVLHAAGVPMMAGTDAMGIGTVGGFSLHEELRNFVESGLSPFEALRTATSNPARFLETNDFGTVTTGARADLVLLDANPLVDVANANRRAGVMTRGRWHPERELQRIVDAMPRAYADEERFLLRALHGDIAKALKYLDENDFGRTGSYLLAKITAAEGTDALVKIVRRTQELEPSSVLVAERTINDLGYGLLRAKDFAKAIEVFQLNIALYPKAANTYDSLAEAYDASGEVGKAVETYRRALEVSPQYANAEFATEYVKKHEAR
ncbi:MAG TPA: amidohydrolase family protein [Thermoanaerobaculia bacterium]|nr:amidohydrolase family protein [Thermoanaerobaculia bacterium]